MTVTRSIIVPGTSEGELAYWDAQERRWEGGGGLSGDDFVLKAGDTMTGKLDIRADAWPIDIQNSDGTIKYLRVRDTQFSVYVPTWFEDRFDISTTAYEALNIADENSTVVLTVSTNFGQKEVLIQNGSDLSGHSGFAGIGASVKKWWIDSATGDATFLGSGAFDHVVKISTVTPTTGWVVTWNGSEYVPQAAASVPSTLESLTNVADPAPASNEVLTYTGSAWDGVAPSWLPTAGGTVAGALTVSGATTHNATTTVAGAALLVHQTGAAFRVRQTNGTTEGMVMDSSTGLQLRNGLPMRFYSDNTATNETASVSGTTGNAQFDGTVQADTDFTVGANTILTTSLNFTLDDGGSVLTTGIKGDISVPFKGTIQSVRLLADVSGSIVIDLWKAAYASYPPTVANTITASAKPTLSAVIKNEDLTLTGWNKAVAAGDIIRVNVDSVATVTRVTLALTIKRVA